MIKIGFSTSKALTSRAIRWVTRSRVSHVFLLVEDSFLGQDMVMEAIASGFQLIPYSNFKSGNEIVTLITPVVPLDDGVKKATDWLGEKYNFEGLAGMLLVLAGRWLGRKWRNPLRSAHSVFCSEVATMILQSVNYPGVMDLDPQSTDPEDLEECLTKAA
jgi:hypothetical protein